MGDLMDTSISTSNDIAMTSGVGDFAQSVGSDLQILSKSVTRLARYKTIDRQINTMNLVDLRKQLEDLGRTGLEISMAAEQAQNHLKGYAVVRSPGDQEQWALTFSSTLGKAGWVVEGEFPLFKVFPIEIKIDFANDLVTVNKRTVRKLHPVAVANEVEKELTRLYRERFNPNQFMKALLRAYQVLIAESMIKAGPQRKSGSTVPLVQVFELLSLRSSYTLNQFAFDIYRLRSQPNRSYGEYQFIFGSGRDRGSVVITLPGGQKEVLGSLEVIKGGGQDD